MTTETINGLHSCKPGNDPVVGQIKTFVIEHRKGKSGKPYIKIRSANAENGGTPHRILGAEKTDFVDQHGNISFNLEIESAPNGAFSQARATMQQGEDEPPKGPQGPLWHPEPPVHAPQSSPQRFSMLDERQRAIIRQHSQSMALEVLKLKVTLNELTVEDLTPAKLRQLADYFDADVIGAAE